MTYIYIYHTYNIYNRVKHNSQAKHDSVTYCLLRSRFVLFLFYRCKLRCAYANAHAFIVASCVLLCCCALLCCYALLCCMLSSLQVDLCSCLFFALLSCFAVMLRCYALLLCFALCCFVAVLCTYACSICSFFWPQTLSPDCPNSRVNYPSVRTIGGDPDCPKGGVN